jgi:hypothetical protein
VQVLVRISGAGFVPVLAVGFAPVLVAVSAIET